LYKKTKEEIIQLTGYELIYREIETNAFEIAWGREMVNYYRFAKQAFIKVSKRMGHRTLKDTIALLEFDIMEDIDLKLNFYDAGKYNPLENYLEKELDFDITRMISLLKYQFDGSQRNTKRFPYWTPETL
jgi:hypothetical protein